MEERVRWRGESGQIWVQVGVIGDRLRLVPEYQYDDSTLKTHGAASGEIQFTERQLNAMGFKRIETCPKT